MKYFEQNMLQPHEIRKLKGILKRKGVQPKKYMKQTCRLFMHCRNGFPQGEGTLRQTLKSLLHRLQK